MPKKRKSTKKTPTIVKSGAKTTTPPHEMVQLGQYLKNLRGDLDMTLRGAAELARLSPAHLCKIEQGTVFKSIGFDVLIRLASVYDIPLLSILEEAELIQKQGNNLPDFAQYLRSKYNFSPQAIRDLETAREVVDKKYQRKKDAQLGLF